MRKKIEARRNSIITAREVKNNSRNVQESELDEAIEPYVPLDGFVDVEDGQGSFAFLPTAQRSSLPQPPASRAQNLSAPSKCSIFLVGSFAQEFVGRKPETLKKRNSALGWKRMASLPNLFVNYNEKRV